MKNKKYIIVQGVLLFLGVTLSMSCAAYEHGHWGSHGHGVYSAPAYPAWGGPNVIITVPIVPVVPSAPYYTPVCQQVQVCNHYNECWLEERCN